MIIYILISGWKKFILIWYLDRVKSRAVRKKERDKMGKIVKLICIVFLVWLAFALISSTVFALLPITLSGEKKETFSDENYYGNHDSGPDRALLIETPEDALSVRLAMVKVAEKSIDMVAHSFKNSTSAQALLAALFEAADRGVQIRILVDGKTSNFNGGNKILKDLASHPNITCKIYNPMHLLKPWNWHMLLHDKFIIADDQYLLLGGRNIDERHFAPEGYNKPITYDRDVLIQKTGGGKGDVVSGVDQTCNYMEILWKEGCVKTVVKDKSGVRRNEVENIKTVAQAFEIENRKFYQKTLEHYLGETVTTKKATLIYNPTGAHKKEPWVAYRLQLLVERAKDEVFIQTPYATGNNDLLESLHQNSIEKQVNMLTNSLASTPNILAFSNYLGQRQKFLDTGIDIYEYQSTNSIHGKSLLIDNRLAIIGSFNLDDRSFYLNTETMLIIDSEELARQLKGVMEDTVGRSLKVGRNNIYEDEREKALPVAKGKSILSKIVYWIMKPFQGLL